MNGDRPTAGTHSHDRKIQQFVLDFSHWHLVEDLQKAVLVSYEHFVGVLVVITTTFTTDSLGVAGLQGGCVLQFKTPCILSEFQRGQLDIH